MEIRGNDFLFYIFHFMSDEIPNPARTRLRVQLQTTYGISAVDLLALSVFKDCTIFFLDSSGFSHGPAMSESSFVSRNNVVSDRLCSVTFSRAVHILCS